MATHACDFIIIGGGIIGLNMALSLRKSLPLARIIIIEKENGCGLHASGRNSGVIHAGFYYSADSLKAKFTKLGNQLLTEYCTQRNIPINQCGKLVVAQNEADLKTLDILLQRGRSNGVILHEIPAIEAKAIEPRALTYKRALFSPTTSTVDPKQVMQCMRQDAAAKKIQIHCNVKYLKRKKHGIIVTSQGEYHSGFVINAAGLYADKIARDFDFSQNYRILPFKGIYLYSNEPINSFKTLIYPVPDLLQPFLGVHVTINAYGQVKLGPTAIPALWREQYDFHNNFNMFECLGIIGRQLGLLVNAEFDFRKFALEELKKYSKTYLLRLANTLACGMKKENFTKRAPAGIRAQLLNIKEKKLEMDYIIEGDKHSLHILNAVSPGFTSALPFCDYVCGTIL